MYPVSGLLFDCVVGVWLGLGSVYVSSRWLSVSGGVQLILACVCVCVCVYVSVCVHVCVCVCVLMWHEYLHVYNLCDFTFVLYYIYRFLCSITCLYWCKRKCFDTPLCVLKLMSLILVKVNCPVRDDWSFLTWLSWFSTHSNTIMTLIMKQHTTKQQQKHQNTNRLNYINTYKNSPNQRK